MLKLMLADNDIETLRNFRSLLRMYFPNVKVIDVNPTPQIFLEEAKKAEPDFVVFDVRFFGANLFVVLEELTASQPNVRYIPYGYYDDTPYIEKIMPLGVVDYMYRPVKTFDFERAMKRAVNVYNDLEKINSDRRNTLKELEKNKLVYRDIFLRSVLDGSIDNEAELAETFQYFGIKLQPPYAVIMLKLDKFKSVIATLGTQEKLLVCHRIKKITEERLNVTFNGISVTEKLNMLTVIVGGIATLDGLIHFSNELKQAVTVGIKQSLTLGIGRIYNKLSDITYSYREAEAALRHRYYMGYNSVLPLQFVEPDNKITYVYPIENEKKLVYAAGLGQYDYCMSLSKKLFDSLKDKVLPPGLVQKILTDIVFSIIRFANEIENRSIDKLTRFFPTKEMLEVNTPQDAFEYLSVALKDFCECMISIRAENADKIIERVKTQIDTSFLGKLNLAEIALRAETVPEYLSRIFLNSESMTVYDYLTSIRVQKAKQLLAETTLDEDTIAQTVGFDDYAQLRIVFKQFAGEFPSEYRRRH